MSTSSTSGQAAKRPAWLVILLCWAVVVLDGYDLIVYGTTLPLIFKEPWGITATSAGLIASFGFVGMMIGAMGAGTIADFLGRRKAILLCAVVFTTFTLLTYFAPNQEIFGVLRFLAGLGLGGLMPSTNALSGEFVTNKNRSIAATVMLSGIPIGGSLAALLGLSILPSFGWRAMYLLAGAGFVLIAALWFTLPESPTWLRTQGREQEAQDVAARWGVSHTLEPVVANEGKYDASRPTKLTALLAPEWKTPVILFSVSSLFTLFTWYGLGTWLPKIMSADPHFARLMPDPLVFLLSLNVGAVAGSFLTAWVATKVGPLKGSLITATLTVPALLFLITVPDSAAATMAALLLAGVGGHGTTCLITAAIVSHFPSNLRGKALGFTAGSGRVGGIAAPYIAGALMDAGMGTSGSFLMFSIGAGFCLLTLTITWRVLTRARNRGTANENPQEQSVVLARDEA